MPDFARVPTATRQAKANLEKRKGDLERIRGTHWVSLAACHGRLRVRGESSRVALNYPNRDESRGTTSGVEGGWDWQALRKPAPPCLVFSTAQANVPGGSVLAV